MKRYFYSATIGHFNNSSNQEILGTLAQNNSFALDITQKNAWIAQIAILKNALAKHEGSIFFEYSIPRMGRRIDTVVIIKNTLFVLEFKVGEKFFPTAAVDQVFDYALDLKNFHETSHDLLIAPILIATEAETIRPTIRSTSHNDKILFPINTSGTSLDSLFSEILQFSTGKFIELEKWSEGRYSPTPTIIEAAMALYNGHDVAEISRTDAAARNLTDTSSSISTIISESKARSRKSICFVTGVPGAGKTLVGLNTATSHLDKNSDLTSVFLSGNGPLVAVLREALTRDKFAREKLAGKKVKKGEIMSAVKVFIQNVHHYRDECLVDESRPPFDHVAIFDEAQRAWNQTQTANFMKQKKGRPEFMQSEPEFLISCLDRHKDWAVIVCLVGGGQEINTGEAGISEWINSLNRSYPEWNIYVSSRLTDSEYAAGNSLKLLEEHKSVFFKEELHLSVSLRSFRAEHLSTLVKHILDLEVEAAASDYELIKEKYPIVLTRDLQKAKDWLREKARGSERYGVVVSSNAQRLKPLAIDVRSPADPIHWFLDRKDDVRSSFYLEDAATEFQVQGMELDWVCVTWDADFRYSGNGWESYSFVGQKWNNVNKSERKLYLKNAYRVLLTRARQGMVIVVPSGDLNDKTRIPEFYDTTFEYLEIIGFKEI